MGDALQGVDGKFKIYRATDRWLPDKVVMEGVLPTPMIVDVPIGTERTSSFIIVSAVSLLPLFACALKCVLSSDRQRRQA